MIVTTKVGSISALMKFLDGAVVTTETAGSNSVGSKTFSDTSVNFSTLGVAVGDSLHIFGVGVFEVATVGTTSLTVVTPIAPSTSAQGYRILRNGVGEAQLHDLQGTADGGFNVLYDPFLPPRSKGFMVNTTEMDGVPTSYTLGKKVELNWQGTLADSGASEPHDQVKISHLELHFDNAASVTGVEFALTWDAAGNVIALGPTASAVTPFSGFTSNHRAVSASFGEQAIDFRNSSAESGKKLYLHLKLTGGTGDLQTARLYWFV